jgi:hypothetical protein
VRQAQSDLGSGSGTVTPGSFSLLDVTVPTSGSGAYRLNGSSDGTVSGSGFGNTVQTIGSNQNGLGGELFSGDIAEIDIYSGILTSTQITAEEAVLTAEYITPASVPEPSTWAMLLVGLGTLAVVRRYRTFSQA